MIIKRALIALAFALWLFTAHGQACAQQSNVYTEIEVQGLRSIDESELLYLLDLKPGAPVEPAALREGIKRAFLKGIFHNITVEAPDGMPSKLIVKVLERQRIRAIRPRGLVHLSADYINRNHGIPVGETYNDEVVSSRLAALQAQLRQAGFPTATVSALVVPDDEPGWVVLYMDIAEGQEQLVTQIEYIGPEQYSRSIKVELGSRFDAVRFERQRDALLSSLRKKGQLNPKVDATLDSEGVLHISVEPGKHLSVEVRGLGALPADVVSSLLPFQESGEVSPQQVALAVGRLREHYHSRGNLYAQVAALLDELPEGYVLRLYLNAGPQVSVDELRFTGNEIAEDVLSGLVATKRGKAYIASVLDDDLSTVRDFYLALGYSDVTVGPPVLKVKDSKASIEVPIFEGAQLKIKSVEFAGAVGDDARELVSLVPLSVDMPYNEVDISDSRRAILTYYREHGYPDVSVKAERERSGNGVGVTFYITPGQAAYFGKTIIIGNAQTRREVIVRELEYKEGELYNAALLAKTQRKLYELGIFSSAQFLPLDTTGARRDMALRLKEGRAGTLEFGLGYGDYEQYRGFFDIGYRNLFGMNNRASLRLELSTLENRVLLNFNEPWFMQMPVQWRAFFLREDRREINIDTKDTRFRVLRYTAATGLERQLSQSVKGSVFYDFSLVETSEVDPDVVLSKEDTGTLSISSISPSLIMDTRDDPMDPHRGALVGLTLKVASGTIMSETDFIKATLRASAYQRLSRLVVAVGARGGVAQGYAGTSDIPIVERFFLGGRNSVRGYAQDTLGPKGPTGTPTGGAAFVQGNVEFRYMVAHGWRVIGFVDAGGVWPHVADISFADVKYAAGFGVQYLTPVGPIKIDYGFKIKPEEGESTKELHFSIGHAF